MNLVLHQFRTDVRHFRWRLIVLWLSFMAETALVAVHQVSGNSLGFTHFLLDGWLVLFALALVASLVQADPFAGAGAAWLARPIRRRHLFWAKTAFIVLCLFVPWLAFQTLESALRGYSFHLGLAAVEQALLFGLAFVLVVAVLAALTPDLGRFFLAAGIAVAGIFAAVLIVDMLVHANVLRAAHLRWEQEPERAASAQAIAWLMLAAGALAAWISQARAGRWGAAVACLAAGFLAFPVVTTVWSKNFLAPRLAPSAPLSVSLVESNRLVVSEPQKQLLSLELAANGVPPGEVAVLQDATATVTYAGDQRPTPLGHVLPPVFQHRPRPVGSAQQNDYFGIVKSFFPAETVWFSDNFYSGVASAFNLESIYRRFNHGLPPGKLDGDATVDLFDVRKVAEEPLRFATFQAVPGVRVTIQKVRLAGGVIVVSLDECTAQLMLDRDVNTAGAGNFNGMESFCTYVIYHPGSGEGFVVSQNNFQQGFPALLSGESHLGLELRFPYPALRERLGGVPAADWLREARLCVFAPVYAGTSHLAFHDDQYQWPSNYDGNVNHQKEKLNDSQIIGQATLPKNPTPAQLNAYLDDILLNMPDNWDGTLQKTAMARLMALGTNGLPALLQRLPLAQNLEFNFVFNAISKIITRDQLPELRAALQRDDNVVDVFQRKHWEADAQDVLVARLADHRRLLNAQALCIAAGAKDPATYADLRWQFVHLQEVNYYDSIISALEQCPGFDTAGAVREAWQNARLGVIGGDGLAIVAAKYGLPDALSRAIVHAEAVRDPDGRQRELAALATLTGYTGPTNNTLPWLVANSTRFHFDPSAQHYGVGP